MSQRPHIKSRIKSLNPVFHKRDKTEDKQELSEQIIKLARKSGQLRLCNRGLATVPDKVWNLLQYEEHETDYRFDMERPKDEDAWWNQIGLSLLDLSSNSLMAIPTDIRMLVDLTTLSLHDNNITTLPNELEFLEKLMKLNISHNKLTSLPDGLFKLPNLRELNVSHNKLEDANSAMGDLVMLESLDLSHNNLNALPSGLGFLTRVTHLNLAYNQLKLLPPDIVNLRVLIKIDITHNELDNLPEAMGELRKLELLYGQHNNITTIPDFNGCVALKELYLGNNFIKEFPMGFCEDVPHLKILDLRDNKLEEVPEDISMLQHLTRLDLTNNSLTMIPTSIAMLSHLQNLQIDGNLIRTIRRDVIQRGTQSILKILREKIIEDGGTVIESVTCKPPQGEFSGLPDRLWYAMKTNRSLVVPGRELSYLPEQIFKEARDAAITILDISKNKFQTVPEEVSSLSATIQELNVSSNLLISIPASIGILSRLQYLELSKNNISDLPSEIGELKYLRELVLSNNKFKSIPDCIYDLPSLEILLVRDNQIECLIISGPNGGLDSLKRLTVFDVANNNINFVPPELGNLKQIRSLELSGNPFRQPRHAIISKGTDTIMSYLRDRIPQ